MEPPATSRLLVAMLHDCAMGQSGELIYFFSGFSFLPDQNAYWHKKTLQELTAGGGEQTSSPQSLDGHPTLYLKLFVRLSPSPVSEEKSILVFTCFDLLCGL